MFPISGTIYPDFAGYRQEMEGPIFPVIALRGSE